MNNTTSICFYQFIEMPHSKVYFISCSIPNHYNLQILDIICFLAFSKVSMPYFCCNNITISFFLIDFYYSIFCCTILKGDSEYWHYWDHVTQVSTTQGQCRVFYCLSIRLLHIDTFPKSPCSHSNNLCNINPQFLFDIK